MRYDELAPMLLKQMQRQQMEIQLQKAALKQQRLDHALDSIQLHELQGQLAVLRAAMTQLYRKDKMLASR